MKRRNEDIKKSAVFASLKGVSFAVGITVAGSYLIAYFIGREYLPESWIGYGAMILLILSPFLGCTLCNILDAEKRLLINVLIGMFYYGILIVMTAVFFQGKYEGIGVSGLLVVVGCGLSAFPKNKGRKRKRAGRRR